MARQYLIFKLMLVIGYTNQFTVVQRQLFWKIFVKDKKMNSWGLTQWALVPLERISFDCCLADSKTIYR